MGKSILSDILEYKHDVIRRSRDQYKACRKNARKCPVPGAFKTAISLPGQVNLIAEIKKASPSKGLIRKDFDLLAIARAYEKYGAAAISVLTEDKYFMGRPQYIRQVSGEIRLPVLTKDFILEEGQIYEARDNGASAVLLIVALLDKSKMKDLIQLNRELGMDSLVEIHTEDELDPALDAGAEIIGVNNRDLTTFTVDVNTCPQVAPNIPRDRVVVAESGYYAHEQIKSLRGIGVHAVLIGETFMKEKDIGRKIREVMVGK